VLARTSIDGSETWSAVELGETTAPAVPVAAMGTDLAEERYAHLGERAAAFVRERGGAAHEDVLIAHVFGSLGSPLLWRPLLRRLLGPDDGLVLRSDGFWVVPGAATEGAENLLGDFVVVDVETTGLRPLQQRIIEIAAIRYRDGRETGRVETLIDPQKRIPKYITELTGITDADVAEAPRFAAVADELIELVASVPVVGHNVDFDLGFLNAELKRVDRPALINERFDTLGMATRLVAGLRKPKLASVAQALGLMSDGRKLHRAGADAALTAEVAMRLADLAREQGVTSFDGLKRLGGALPSRPREPRGRGRAVLDRSLLADIPKAPGVYLMRDAFDGIVYVGKAKNLRDRVASYYSQPLGYTRKMDGLLESLVRIDVEVVGSELEALLLESQLIKRYQPRYNTALRSFEHYPFIRVDVATPWPRVTLAKQRKEDGARYFGPFRNKTGARKTVDLINRIVPLRTCTRSFKDARSYGSPCLELDLGRCLGPCVGRADRDEYAGLVRRVVAFLDGRDDALYEILWAGLEETVAKLDFERAAALRRDLQQVNGVVGAQRRLREAAETQTLLLVLPSADPRSREVLLVARGRLWAQLRGDRAAGPAALAERLAAAWRRCLAHPPAPVDHATVDETNILNRWLYQHAGHPAILPLVPSPDDPDFASLAVRVFALTDDDLTSDVRPTDADEIEDVATEIDAAFALPPRPADGL
jgi:DNA polymerase III epsilon subunit family exonuclease